MIEPPVSACRIFTDSYELDRECQVLPCEWGVLIYRDHRGIIIHDRKPVDRVTPCPLKGVHLPDDRSLICRKDGPAHLMYERRPAQSSGYHKAQKRPPRREGYRRRDVKDSVRLAATACAGDTIVLYLYINSAKENCTICPMK